MMQRKEIAIESIIGRGTAEELGMRPNEWSPYCGAPIIVCAHSAGGYELLDGYHRLGGHMATGATTIMATIVDSATLDMCREFGDGDMSEGDWIEMVDEMSANLAE